MLPMGLLFYLCIKRRKYFIWYVHPYWYLIERFCSRFMDVAPRRKHRLFVASIDFGTTYSGYAFSSKDEWERDPLNIHKNVWNSSNLMSAKTPTALMLGPKREFLAFGYDAETKYSESEGSFASYYYFHCFKLILQDNDVWVIIFFLHFYA